MDLCQWTGKISKYGRHLARDNEEDYVEWHFKNRKESLVEDLKGGHYEEILTCGSKDCVDWESTLSKQRRSWDRVV